MSLLSYEVYQELDPDVKTTLATPTVNLNSVTGQTIEVVGATSLTFWVTPELQVTHQFQVTRGLKPYEAILGLDFLANPAHQIRHELPSFILCFKQTPIPLFNASRQTPCATVLSVKARGRHQYVGPRAVTFVRIHVAEQAEELNQAQGYEFHPHPVMEGAPQPVPCFFDRCDIENGELLIGIINTSGQGMYVKNDEPVGYLLPVSTQPFQDMVASVMLKREQVQYSRQSNLARDGGPSHGPNSQPLGQEKPDQEFFGDFQIRRFDYRSEE